MTNTLLCLFPLIAIAAQVTADECGCGYGTGRFCGSDGNCHIYNCEEWHEFGPQNFTGNDGSQQLTCQDIPITNPGDLSIDSDPFYPSVAYRCRSLTPAPIEMGFTRRCSAEGILDEFVCYGLANDTDFQPFVEEAAASGLNCTDNEYDEAGYPQFTYTVQYSSHIDRQGSTIFQQGFNGTSELNETVALVGTMTSDYRRWTAEPTAAPTAAPTRSPTASPIINSASTNLQRRSLIVSAVGLSTLFMLPL